MQHQFPQSGINEGVIVFFGNGDNRCWWLKDGFRHCGVLIKGVFGTCCYVETTWGGFFIHSLCHMPSEEEVLQKYMEKGVWSAYVVMPRTPYKPRFNITILTCVTLVKQVLGIRKWWIQTPYQLYRYLLTMSSTPYEKRT